MSRWLPVRKTVIAAVILLAALSLWLPRQAKLRRAQHELRETEAQAAVLQDRVAAAAAALERAQYELDAENLKRNEAKTGITRVKQELARSNPEAAWVEPPATLPAWDADSPYVWLQKKMVPRFPISAFDEDGRLRREVAHVLTIDPDSERALNEKLKQSLAEYRALEAAKAEVTEDHLPGIAGEKGEKLTLRVQPLPEEGARIEREFKAALTEALGEQRSTLLLQASEMWLDSQFAQVGGEPKTISVIRHPWGSVNVSIRSGRSWFSTGGPAKYMEMQIPPHLRSRFAGLLEPESSAASNTR